MARALVDSLGEKLKAAGIDQGEQRVKCARMHVSPPADPDKHGGFFYVHGYFTSRLGIQQHRAVG